MPLRPSFTSAAFRHRAGVAAVYDYPELPSTNSKARELAESGAPDRSVVITRRQTRGRGRGKNRWWSDPGTLTLSIILRPHISIDENINPSLISLVTGLAVVRAIRRLAPQCPVGVKWPNDIGIFDSRFRKIGGILVESGSRQGRVSFFVIGIGLNINTAFRGAPKELKGTTMSLRQISGREWDDAKVLATLLKIFLGAARDFFKNGFEPFMEDWRRNDVIPIGRSIAIENDGKRLCGTYESILPSGILRLRDEKGNLHRILAGTLIASAP